PRSRSCSGWCSRSWPSASPAGDERRRRADDARRIAVVPTTTDGTEPLIVRPRRARVVAVVAAAVVVVLFSLIAASLKSEAVFSTGDQAAMVGLGVMLAAGVLTFSRPSLHAVASGLRIRNVIGGYELPWEVVRSLRFDHGAAWASLELVD